MSTRDNNSNSTIISQSLNKLMYQLDLENNSSCILKKSSKFLIFYWFSNFILIFFTKNMEKIAKSA